MTLKGCIEGVYKNSTTANSVVEKNLFFVTFILMLQTANLSLQIIDKSRFSEASGCTCITENYLYTLKILTDL